MNPLLHSNPPMRAIALCLLAMTIAASAAPPAGPPELEKLRASYKAAVAKGARSILQSHIATLEKLRDIYTRGANLGGATKVQGDIDRANVAMTSGEFIPAAADSANVSAPELDKLRTGHEADIERALKPYRETYGRELDKLRDNYTRAANLIAANAVQEEIDTLKSGGAPGKAADLPALGKQPRLSGKAPKSEWYIGKTWGGPPGASFTFAKGGKGEVHHTTGKTVPMTWNVLPSGVLELRHEISNSTNIASTFIYLITPVEGRIGLREAALDKPIQVLQK